MFVCTVEEYGLLARRRRTSPSSLWALLASCSSINTVVTLDFYVLPFLLSTQVSLYQSYNSFCVEVCLCARRTPSCNGWLCLQVDVSIIYPNYSPPLYPFSADRLNKVPTLTCVASLCPRNMALNLPWMHYGQSWGHSIPWLILSQVLSICLPR